MNVSIGGAGGGGGGGGGGGADEDMLTPDSPVRVSISSFPVTLSIDILSMLHLI